MSNVMEFYGFQFSTKTHASPELTNAQKCFKGTLLFFNVVFLIFGCVLAAVGSYALTGNVAQLAGVQLPRGIIAIGVFIIIISLLGCFSAWKESRVFLGVYFFFLLIFTIILFAVGIAVYAKKDDAGVYITAGWQSLCSEVPNTSTWPPTYPSTYPICVALQDQFRCCGTVGPYKTVNKWKYPNPYASYNFTKDPRDYYVSGNTLAVLPCLSQEQQDREQNTPNNNDWQQDYTNLGGCLDPMVSAFQSSFVAAGGTAIAFAVIMTCGMIFVCFLMEGIKKKKHLEDIRKLHKKFREAKETETDDSAMETGATAQPDETYDVDAEEDPTRNQRVGDD